MVDLHNVSSWVVLLVEDDYDNTALAQQVLSYHGATVHAAEDGRQALEILKTVTPTVMLVDLAMPGMDGWELLKQVRSNPEQAAIPMIAVTAHAMPESKARALASGFDGYITKPYSLKVFVDDIRSLLENLDSDGE
jgi:two-component system cell cycle response regulator DivK